MFSPLCPLKSAGSAEQKPKFLKFFLLPFTQPLTLADHPENSANFIKFAQVHPIMEGRAQRTSRETRATSQQTRRGLSSKLFLTFRISWRDRSSRSCFSIAASASATPSEESRSPRADTPSLTPTTTRASQNTNGDSAKQKAKTPPTQNALSEKQTAAIRVSLCTAGSSPSRPHSSSTT